MGCASIDFLEIMITANQYKTPRAALNPDHAHFMEGLRSIGMARGAGWEEVNGQVVERYVLTPIGKRSVERAEKEAFYDKHPVLRFFANIWYAGWS